MLKAIALIENKLSNTNDFKQGNSWKKAKHHVLSPIYENIRT